MNKDVGVTTCQSVNPFFDYEQFINDLDPNRTAEGTIVPENQRMNPELVRALKETLRAIKDCTIKVGKEVIEIGKKVIDFLFEAMQNFKRTAAGLLIGAILYKLIKLSTFKWLAKCINPVLLPFALTIIGFAFIMDVLENDTFKQLMDRLIKAIDMFMKV